MAVSDSTVRPVCSFCGGDFDRRCELGRRGTFCSKKCYHASMVRCGKPCERCGKEFPSFRGRNRFCSRACKLKTCVLECARCSAKFIVGRAQAKKKYCSEECVREVLREAAHKRHGWAVPSLCLTCGAPFAKKTNNGVPQRYCSRACGVKGRPPRRDTERTRIRREERVAATAIRRAIQLAARRDARISEMALRRAQRAAERADALQRRPTRTCTVCGGSFQHRGTKFCTDKCARRIYRKGKKHTSRARERGLARCYSIKPEQVYARDKWKCQLCGGRVSKRLMGTNHDDGPSVDHIIPLAVPGSPGHVWSNVQCAHRMCNSRKSDAIVGQLRIF